MNKFTGHLLPQKCELCQEGVPHYPQVVGHYHTNNYGKLEDFCTGIKGEDVDFEYKYNSGNPSIPSTLTFTKKEADNNE